MADKKPTAPKAPPTPVHIGGESFADRLLPHLKKIIIGIVLIAVLLTIIFTFKWIHDRKEVAETEKLAEVLQVADEPIEPPPAAGSGSDATAPAPHVDSFPDTKARAIGTLDTMEKVHTDAAGHAYRASVLVDAGRLDDAIAEYTKGQADPGLDGVLCREGLGLALEAKASAEKDIPTRQKGFEQALAAFTTMQPDEAGPRRAYALYHQGRLDALLGKTADAKAAFEKAKELGKSTDLEELVEKRLATLGAT